MTWQLLYTSAPRSLEAGRSGFGTVARHRAIPALLVSAVERFSQFSRLPGTDAGRVIFSYRKIPIAGGVYHVLSSIRDAGADYTGRTNHIAQHLIATARDVTQVRALGLSPADILLGMKWATSWNEPPRYLEENEAVELSRLTPANTGSAWERAANDPNKALLLASGEAARGAYVIQPAGLDLREIFAESLRLIPDRLWEIPFTTSLQPSDEPADFRWIGIEELSPLRAQTETSGRTTLDLTVPGRLPLVEAVQANAASQTRQAVAQTSAPTLSDEPTASPEGTWATPLQRPSSTPNERTRERQSTSAKAATRSPQKWWLLAGATAILIAASVGFFVGSPIYNQYKHRKVVRAEIASILNKSGFFSDKVSTELKSADAVDIAKEVAVAADRSWESAYSADFSAMRQPLDKALRERSRSAGLNIPPEINALDDRLKKIAGIHQWLRDFHPTAEDYKALDEIEKKRTEAELLTSPTPKTNTFDKIKGIIAPLADQRRAQAVRTLLIGASDGRVQPAESPVWFDRALADTKSDSGDEDTKLILKSARQVIDGWRFVEAQEANKVLTELEDRLKKQSVWPPWLQAKAQSKIDAARGSKPVASVEQMPRTVPNTPKTLSPPPDKPAPLPRVPLYFVNGKDSLPNFRVEEIGPSLNYFLKVGINDKALNLVDLNKNGTLRRSVAGDPDFEVSESQKVIRLAKGAATLPLPFGISAQDAAGAEMFQLWVGNSSGDPLFPMRTAGLSRKGDALELSPTVLGFTGTPKNPLSIKLPESCTATRTGPETQPLANWSVDLSGARKQIEAYRTQWKQQLEELEKKAVEPSKDEKAKFAYLSEELNKEAKFDKEESKHLAADNAPLRAKCGGYVMAVAQTPKITGFDPLFTEGANLKKLDEKADAATEAAAVKTVLKALQEARRNLKTQTEEKLKARLDLLDRMLALLLPETPESQTRRADERESLKRHTEALKARLAAAHPLTSDYVPPGTYRIIARDGGTDIPLVEIQIPQPPKP